MSYSHAGCSVHLARICGMMKLAAARRRAESIVRPVDLTNGGCEERFLWGIGVERGVGVRSNRRDSEWWRGSYHQKKPGSDRAQL